MKLWDVNYIEVSDCREVNMLTWYFILKEKRMLELFMII